MSVGRRGNGRVSGDVNSNLTHFAIRQHGGSVSCFTNLPRHEAQPHRRHRSLSVMRRMPPALPEFVAVYGLLYAAFGVQSPFLPALLREQGLRAEDIGIVLSASTAIRVLAGPAIGHAADRLHRHTSILCGCALAAAVAGFGYLMMQGLGSLLVVGLLHAAMLAPIVPLSDALASTAAH